MKIRKRGGERLQILEKFSPTSKILKMIGGGVWTWVVITAQSIGRPLFSFFPFYIPTHGQWIKPAFTVVKLCISVTTAGLGIFLEMVCLVIILLLLLLKRFNVGDVRPLSLYLCRLLLPTRLSIDHQRHSLSLLCIHVLIPSCDSLHLPSLWWCCNQNQRQSWPPFFFLGCTWKWVETRDTNRCYPQCVRCYRAMAGGYSFTLWLLFTVYRSSFGCSR